jgi:hypothetical protein
MAKKVDNRFLSVYSFNQGRANALVSDSYLFSTSGRNEGAFCSKSEKISANLGTAGNESWIDEYHCRFFGLTPYWAGIRGSKKCYSLLAVHD